MVKKAINQKTRDEIGEMLAAKRGISKLAGREILAQVFELIHDELSLGGEVMLNNFGKFSVRHGGARNYHSPQTGEVLRSEGKTTVRFRAGNGLKNEVAKVIGAKLSKPPKAGVADTTAPLKMG